jgi:hypothetical protein
MSDLIYELTWSFDKPAEAGTYWCNAGDVVSILALRVVVLKKVGGVIVDQDGSLVSKYHHKAKWLLIDGEFINFLNGLGNE